MAIQLDWIPYSGSNSVSQDVVRADIGVIANVGPSVNTYTDSTADPNTLYEYAVSNNCLVGGPQASSPAYGVSWECPGIYITDVGGNFKVTTDPIAYGYFYSIDLYDVNNVTLEANGDPFPPTQDPLNQEFVGLSPGTYYTVRVVIIAQDTDGQPSEPVGTYTYDCTEQGYIGLPPACPNASNVTANPQY